MVSTQCAICGVKQNVEEVYKENFSSSKINSHVFSARRTPDRLHYRFLKCLNCGMIFSSPILPANKIDKFYLHSTFDYDLEAFYLKKTYGYYLRQVLKNVKREEIRLLDIGCGNGFFLEEAKEMGVGFVYGIEPGKETIKKAPSWLRKNIKMGIFEKGIVKNNTYDIVCCFHTLDHIVDPNTFLQNTYESLKRGGKVLFIVHDTEGLSVKLFKEKSPIFDIEHIYLFNKTTLEKIFIKNKFKIIKTFAVENRYPLKYWIRMSPIPTKVKQYILLLLNKTNLANLPLTLRAGNIGIIAQK